jgi:hypothetical protein
MSANMDVLKGVPPINWSHFAQGPVSDPMWHAFKQLVTLCHCVEHWRTVRDSHRLTRAPKPLYPETPYMRKELQDEWKQPAIDSENRMHRAANLADEKVADMSRLVPPGDQGGTTPDFKLCAAAVFSIGRSLGRARARYKSLALDSFDAAAELSPEPDIIANQWLLRAGYPDSQPQL